MFSTTFIGHQGWMFQSEGACLLADPLLCEEFGQAHALQYRVFPPRTFHWDHFPRVDAVLLTHEHDDHFDIPSLSRIDRRVPIFLSARSSVAGYEILRRMGFTVHPLVPGVPLTFAELEVFPLCGDHVRTNNSDEWDTLPYLVRHTRGDGSFFSTVDVALTQGLLEAARARARLPGLFGWTNNAQDWSHVATFLPQRDDGTEQATQRMRAGHALISGHWGTPAAMLFCAGGFSFHGDRAWLNQRVFCVDTEKVCKKMGALFAGQRFYSTRPGQTLRMEQNQLRQVEMQAPFLTTPPPPQWPSRERNPIRTAFPDYAPATGRTALSAEERAALPGVLAEFAGSLVGGTLFKGLYSLLGTDTPGRVGTFAFVLRSADAAGEAPRLVLAYNPNACAFDEA